MAKETFTGTLRAVEQNRRDGTYPINWREFYVEEEDGLKIWVHVETGGGRDRLLTMVGQKVMVDGWKTAASRTLVQGDSSTVRGAA